MVYGHPSPVLTGLNDEQLRSYNERRYHDAKPRPLQLGNQAHLVPPTFDTVVFSRWARCVTSGATQSLFISGRAQASGFKGWGMNAERVGETAVRENSDDSDKNRKGNEAIKSKAYYTVPHEECW